jgi:RNA polymerase sigma factor (sigma-70 family)
MIDYTRSVKREKSQTQNVSDFVDDKGNEYLPILSDNNSSKDVENDQLLDSINESFDSLDENYQRIANLYFVEQLTYSDIADICDITENNVKQLIFRARKMLQAKLTNVAHSYSIG